MTARPTDPPQGDDFVAGVRLGLPATGPGSVAGWGSRVFALALDWLLANLAALALVRTYAVWSSRSGLTWVPFAVWFVEVWLLTALTGASAGQRLRRLQVIRLDRRPVGLAKALVRTALVALVIPPLVYDRDSRGLHDKVTGTVVVHAGRGLPPGGSGS